MNSANMIMKFGIVLCLQLLLTVVAQGSIWATPAEEALDEKHDAEIYRAVVESMAKWRQRKNMHPRHKRAETNVCYGDLGCFEATGPFSYLEMTPSPPTDIGTKFFMYPGRRAGRSINPLDVPYENMTTAWDWAEKGGFNKSLPTKVIVHGFGSSCTNIWVYEMRSALMAVEECNIICVDWEAGAVIPNYVRAAANTRLVGAQLARLLKGLQANSGLSTHNMHLIGFSLGAHVAGFAGSELGGNISRITGLDPAGPLFESQDPRVRLDSTDANFVDVIHSNGENLILGGLGSWQPMGHVDFYPNGGRMQKGCSNLFVGAVSDIIWSSAVEGRSLCNHRRAYKFFTDSVSPRCQFPAFPCDSYENFFKGKCFPCGPDRPCGNMGYYADKSTGRGQLYLITREEEPFCAHQYEVKIESSPSETSVVSYGKILITLVGEGDLNETFTMTQKDDQELVLGGSLAKILVPHPILGEPVKVQIMYVAYSGWLSSGLRHWKIDKISLTDSFGKTISVCQKELELRSGVATVLPLYSGDCQPPKNLTQNSLESDQNISNESNETQSENETSSEFGIYQPKLPISKFIPTPVVKIGNEAIENPPEENISIDRKNDLNNDALESLPLVLTTAWKPIGDYSGSNTLDELVAEKEASRALNTRAVKLQKTINDSYIKKGGAPKEIVEPILKLNPPLSKISRSHNINRIESNSEISEPLLGSTTSRSFQINNKQENIIPTSLHYSGDLSTKHFAADDEDDWKPTSVVRQIGKNKLLLSGNGLKKSESVPENNRSAEQVTEKSNDSSIIQNILSNRNLRNIRDRQDTNVLKDDGSKEQYEDSSEAKDRGNIVSITVQLLPQRLASILHQAERYARMTLLPLISAHTPKILSEFVNTFTEPNVKYLPLNFTEPETTTGAPPPPPIKTNISGRAFGDTFYKKELNATAFKTLHSNSLNKTKNAFKSEQKKLENDILKKNETVHIVYPQKVEDDANLSKQQLENQTNIEPIVNKSTTLGLNIGEVLVETTTKIQEVPEKLVVKLPVYDKEESDKLISTEDLKENRYIPLKFDNKAPTEKT